jgi:hypothetical protein
MMSYGLLTPGYGQSYADQTNLYHRLASKVAIWSYPQDRIFFRSRMSEMPNNSKAPTVQRSLSSNRNVCSPSQLSSEIGGNNGYAGALEKLFQVPIDILYEVSRSSSSSQMSWMWAELEPFGGEARCMCPACCAFKYRSLRVI